MSEKPKSASRFTLWAVAAVCIAPFVASFMVYFLWPPAGRVNYGELLQPAPLPAAQLRLVDGGPFDFSRLAGKWILVTVDSGACDDHCRQKLWKMRQVRRAQGKDMERIERVWLVNDGQQPDPRVLEEYEGTWAVFAAGSPVLASLPAEGVRKDHVYLVDPLGNVMLRFPPDADPSRMKKDIVRLLKVSRIG